MTAPNGPDRSPRRAPDEFHTDRLVLVRPSLNDADEIFSRYASSATVAKYLGWAAHGSVEDTRAFLRFTAAEWERWPAGPYLIRTRSDRRLVGSTGLAFDVADRAMTGYVIAEDSWGRGFATEALGGIMQIARAVGVRHLFAFCHPEHRASWRVLEKCGFRRDLSWSQPMTFPNLTPAVPRPVLRYTTALQPVH
jgi:RimJ/RimL family protein N-acetyltransferase